MSRAALSESIQDYLKSVYKLQSEHGRVTIGAIAKDQSVSAASASAMVKKLAALELLEHEPYREQLPSKQCQVIVLRDVEGWEADEVCQLLELSEANQRVLLHRARSKVRQALEEQLG